MLSTRLPRTQFLSPICRALEQRRGVKSRKVLEKSSTTLKAKSSTASGDSNGTLIHPTRFEHQQHRDKLKQEGKAVPPKNYKAYVEVVKSSPKQIGPKQISSNDSPILEALFPEDARPAQSIPQPPTAPTLPKLDNPLRFLRDNRPTRQPPTTSPSSPPPPSPSDPPALQTPPTDSDPENPLLARHRPTTTLLVHRTASPSLLPSDFHRLSPRGTHIDNWTSGLLAVIPARDPTTLAPLSSYLLVFSTASAAAYYRDRVKAVHQLAAANLPAIPSAKDVESPLKDQDPQPLHAGVASSAESDDLRNDAATYTLLPASLPQPRLGKVLLRYNSRLSKVAEAAGSGQRSMFAHLTPWENLVLINLEGGGMGVEALRSAIGRDGKERNLMWELAGEGDIVVLGGNQVAERGDEEGDWAGEDESQEFQELQRERSGNGRNGKGAKKGHRTEARRFIVALKGKEEMKRFVREWNGRVLLKEASDPRWEDIEIRVRASILW